MQVSLKTETPQKAEFILTNEHKEMLHHIARRSIEHGLSFGHPLPADPQEYLPPLTELKPVFVTLRIDGELRGCVGTLEAEQPLVSGVSKFAFAAAYNDTRFASVTEREFTHLHVQISVLSELEQLRFNSEKELIEQLRQGIDGLVLLYSFHRGTLLPSVWDEIREPREFLVKLKQKAGLPADFWASTLEVKRYTTMRF